MLSNNGLKAKSLRDVIFPSSFMATEAARKTQGQTVIAHISDLHFTSKTNFDVWPWSALLEDFASSQHDKIDLLAVTGDLIDASFRDYIQSRLPRFVANDPISEAFYKVNSYLETLCKALKIDCHKSLVVVPGNHDYRAKGILMTKKLPVKFYSQFKGYCRPILLPELNLCVFVIDSNTMSNKLDLATGLIERDDLVKFRRFAEQIHPVSSACTRVVLLHHHPMPIPAREDSTPTNNPGFTLLKNAGQFMSLMVEAKVNLVLHGHEHHHAFSKAFFPDDQLQEHMITVIGAGSAGEKADQKSYNLITIADGGQMTLERRCLEGAVYRHQYRRSLGDYRDTRRASFDGFAAKAGALLSAEKYSEMYVIKSISGDASVYERFEGVSAFKDDLPEYNTQVWSDSGFFSAPELSTISPSPETQQVRWDWASREANEEGAREIPARKAKIIYKPVLTKNSMISYELRRKAYNLFHFYKQEREDTTNGKSQQEEIKFTFRNSFELYVLTVTFPEDKLFPRKFYREVHGAGCFGKEEHDDTCTRDLLEEEYFNQHFSRFNDSRTFVASIERPLPGYTYLVRWDLDSEDDKLEFIDEGRAHGLIKKLLILRDKDNPYQARVKEWLKSLKDSIIKSRFWRSLDGTDDMEIFLYTYNRETDDWEKRGLVCVASTLPNIINDMEQEEVIKPGKTIVGAAYRRKQPMIYSPFGKSPKVAEAEYEYRIPKAWRRADETESIKFSAVCALPMYYPMRENFIGRAVAVLSFASTSDTSRLLNFVPKNMAGLSRQQLEERKKKRDTLVYFTMTTQFRELARALDVERADGEGGGDLS
jgi:predicted MPP superfamily phosphohydrolase